MPMKVAIAFCRSFIGTTSPISASETGIVAAAKIPVSARNAVRSWMPAAVAHSAVAAVKSASEIMTTRSLPNRSASGP